MSVYNISGTELPDAFSVSGSSLADVFDIGGNRIGFDTEPTFLDTAVLTALSSVSTGGTKQGGCTDGQYIYQTSGNTSSYTYMNIIKYKIADGTYTTAGFNGTPNFGHANDMCYNPNNGYLYICTMFDDGSVIVLDSSDLSYVGTIYLTDENGAAYTVWQFCFDRDNNCFYSAHGSNYLVYDENWNYLRSIAMPAHPNATAQGCETDGDYIYRITYNPNYIDVAKVDGTYVKTISLPMSGEPEAIMYGWDGKYYASRNTTGTIFYGVQLFSE